MDRAKQDTRSGLRSRAGRHRALLALALLLTVLAPGRAAADDEATDREYTQFERLGKMGVKALDSGVVIVPARYDFASLPAENLVRVELDDRVAYLDMQGRERIPFSAGWEAGGDFSEGLVRVRRDGVWGFVDATGRVVIAPRFNFAEDFHDGRALVRNQDAGDSYVDRRGELVTELWFDYAEDFRDGYAVVGWVRERRERLGILRRDGELVLEPRFSRIQNLGGGRLTVVRKEGDDYPEYIEGTFTDGAGIEWNDNMAPVNAMVQRVKAFVPRFEDLLDSWLDTGCPCRYPRFRELVLHSPASENLFALARDKFLDEIESDGESRDVHDYACRVCGSRYRATWYEYSIAAQGYAYEVLELRVEDQGAEVIRPVPFLRFQTGYRMSGEEKFREVEDIDEVLDYLACPKGSEPGASEAGR